jgi:hypothetical protein
MFGLPRLAILGFVVSAGATIYTAVDGSRLLSQQFEPPADNRKAESSRRAKLLDLIEAGELQLILCAVEPMPPTSCRSVESYPKLANWVSGPHGIHHAKISWFVNSSGFGLVRMAVDTNKRGIHVASSEIDRIELVSLLTENEPSVYILEHMATPSLAIHAKRRPLDEFERLSLDAVSRGENLMWTREAPTRMFGAIRAETSCLECHVRAKEGDLLGAFTYYLNKPIDQVGSK